MTILEKGQIVPEFSLSDQNNQIHNLVDYRGQTVLIYFYPKDDTSGCTAEACAITEVYDEFKKLEVKVFGVSGDDAESHTAFAKKYHIPFTLLSDTDWSVTKTYGAYKEDDDTELNIHSNRISYLVSPDGVILKAYPEVDPATHALQILKDVKEIAV